MIRAYSDSGTYETTTVATSLFMTDSSYLAVTTKVYYDVETTTEGELIGMCQSMEFLASNFPEERNIQIITDSETLATIYEAYLAGKKLKPTAKYFPRWKRLLELSKGNSISVAHIRGHQRDHNPNKVCDMLSTALLQDLR